MRFAGVVAVMVLTLGLAGCSGNTTAASNVAATSATLNAQVSCSGGSPTPCQYRFQYGTGGSYQYQTPTAPVPGATVTVSSAPVSTTVTGLIPGTTYTYQLCGKGDSLSSVTCVTPPTSFTTPVATDRTISAQQFSDSIGANVQENFYDTPYYNWSQTLTDAKALGITHLRIGIYDNGSQPAWNAKEITDYQNAAFQGFKLDALMPQDCASYLGIGEFQDCFGFLQSKIGLTNVIAAEWPNEQNNDARDPAWGQAIYSLAHPLGIPVYGPSFGLGATPAQMGDQSTSLDFGNLHDYSGGHSPTPSLVQGEMQAMQAVSAGKPIVATEFGNYTMLDGSQGVDPNTQAIYTLRQYFEHLADGIDTSYVYDLYDDHAESSTDYADHYGLINNDDTYKPAATALQYVTALIGTGSAGTVSPLRFAFDPSDQTSDLRYLTIEKADGTYDLVLWRDGDIWNPSTDQPISVSPHTIHVLGNFNPWVAYDPIQGAAVANGNGAATLSIGADPIILQVTSEQ